MLFRSQLSQLDFSAELAQVVAARPDGVLNGGSGTGGALQDLRREDLSGAGPGRAAGWRFDPFAGRSAQARDVLSDAAVPLRGLRADAVGLYR